MENELVAQVSMKQEMELAMKLLEKDIHEKQVSSSGADAHRPCVDVKVSAKLNGTRLIS